METAQSEVMREKAMPQTLEKLVYLILAYIHYKNNFYSKFQESQFGEKIMKKCKSWYNQSKLRGFLPSASLDCSLTNSTRFAFGIVVSQ